MKVRSESVSRISAVARKIAGLHKSLAQHPLDPSIVAQLTQREVEIDTLLEGVTAGQLAVSGLLHNSVRVTTLGNAPEWPYAIVSSRHAPTIGFLIVARGDVRFGTIEEPVSYLSLRLRSGQITPPYPLVQGDALFAPDLPEDFGSEHCVLSTFQELALQVGMVAERVCEEQGITILVVDGTSSFFQRSQRTIAPASIFPKLLRCELGDLSVLRALKTFEGFHLGRSNIL